MEYQETGRFGRITKNLRRKGFENKMEGILHDSEKFNDLNKDGQVQYIETVMDRIVEAIGQKDTDAVLFSCGEQCCGKSWINFAKEIWNKGNGSIDNFIVNLNIAEEKYNTHMSYDQIKKSITVTRTKCICGLVNKGKKFKSNKSFCNCSIGHMSQFFNSVVPVEKIDFYKSIMNGDEKCEWNINLN
jgi:hypothetical protein